ncbi:MAG: hypothetical protein COB37_04245 [Kordiimonadales bacterium]|nr:MAG: hypothetical protein COB37_04245 [Kordiimonadales bacterium]
MTLELTMLFWSTILTFVTILIPSAEAIHRNGAMVQAGARDNLPEPTVFNCRAIRLRNNLLENMVLFTALILIANAAGVSTEQTVLGAQIFFYARVLHAAVYLMGVPMIRPLIWTVSVVGMGMIAAELF